MAKALALFSGGLDSTLAILTVLRQGVEVMAVTFTHFGMALAVENLFSVAKRFGFDVKLCPLSDKFIEIVRNPEFGYGKNINPCVDCKILMLKEAKVLMNAVGADFIVTGEVLGQRPMSQRKDILYLIDKKAAVKGYVLRPLSAKLLEITFPESKGIINRDMLYGFNGRSRKPQMSLAREFAFTDYPQPAGGCLLTEPNYAPRLKDLLTYNSHIDAKDLSLLKLGRHFRFSPSCKIIVGRDKAENRAIAALAGDKDYLLEVKGSGSPLTLVTGEVTAEALEVAASICARYSDAKRLPFVDVSVLKDGLKYVIKAKPAEDNTLNKYRIQSDKLLVKPH